MADEIKGAIGSFVVGNLPKIVAVLGTLLVIVWNLRGDVEAREQRLAGIEQRIDRVEQQVDQVSRKFRRLQRDVVRIHSKPGVYTPSGEDEP